MAKTAYTVEEAAEEFAVSAWQIRNAIAKSDLAAKRVGKQLSISHTNLEAWYETLTDA
ncbi:helix-turn-helix domain-containing protein [Arthrobacter woluwensis]|uniref:DNA binding domain-containing protein, excisionase family n=1 Tax=Arthrobacter woluwensis TaxID=156980 RepID=A0A1H4T8T7_9MICC|nr:helix-turn-helix domain-containing protein [Arthrobacter woluwensis]SEB28927.1 DNA binding domain-containing protein, excisionase family [Arthrobacter woluwensis]SEC52895.1 DNA binding domain-containing protein, excisionase family [Arthrobacter woluwensis]